MTDCVLVQCYNKACGKKFSLQENENESCQHHPGIPVFHDALKGWSCCKKRTTDFSDFLKIPGCSYGLHNSVKPKEEMKPKVESSKENGTKEFTTPAPKQEIIPRKPDPKMEDFERPSSDEPLKDLPIKTTSSYNKQKANETVSADDDNVVKFGIKCRNSGCDCGYTNSPADKSPCLYHPGTAVFHEGMKYWSCCKRKTSDFTAFLNQEGCKNGEHCWKKSASENRVVCRYDWHQTGPNVSVSIFAKNTNIELSTFQCNQVCVKCELSFEGGKKFDLNISLYGVIDPSLSKVTVSGTKVEIVLRKKHALRWKKIGDIEEKVIEEVAQNEDKVKKLNIDEENGDDSGSDLDGIDDVIFD